jgi:hypothetical protein
MDQESKRVLDEICSKSASDLIESEIAFLRARRSYLTDEQRKRFAQHLPKAEKPVKAEKVNEEAIKTEEKEVEDKQVKKRL